MALTYRHTLLIVDDETAILNALKRLFRRESYNILTASNGREGIEILRKVEMPVSLIISDQRMPEMTGSVFLEEAKRIFPDAIRFLLTGYSDMDAIVDAVNRGEIHRYIAKPWNDNDLIIQVRQSLEQFELRIENRRLLALTRKQNKELEELNRHLEKKVEERSGEIIQKNTELSRLNRELESNLFNTVRAFTSLAEMHAPLLAGHGRRVTFISREIAQILKLSEKEIIHTELAALLHDIGKLGFPQRLLEYREHEWTPRENELFQRHPEEGQTIVRFISSLDHVGLLIRSHHECFDGQGYPDHLSEESIPLGARIIAVADAYDKIVHLKVNGKSYIREYLIEKKLTRDHLPEEETLQQAAIHHLKHYAFTRYDPDVVKAFLTLLRTKGIRIRVEKEVSIEGLKEGMVIARSLYTVKGRFLLPYNTVLTGEYIEKLEAIHQNDPVTGVIYVVDNGG